MKKQSLFSSFLNLFYKNNHANSYISAKQAISLQKEYMSIRCSVDSPESAPYIEIIKQLDSDKIEIFNAALYYLEKISMQEVEQKEAIIRMLEKYLKSSNVDIPKKTAIKNVLTRLK